MNANAARFCAAVEAAGGGVGNEIERWPRKQSDGGRGRLKAAIGVERNRIRAEERKEKRERSGNWEKL